MKRTKFPSPKKEQQIPINLIRSIAWTFYKSSKVNWDELFSEACLAYCESIRKYNQDKPASTTTWVYIAMRNALINFCKKEHRSRDLKGIEDWCEVVSKTPMYEFFQESEQVSPDTKHIIQMVRQSPERYTLFPPRKVIGQIKHDLREVEGWSWPRIWSGMKNLRLELI